MCAARYQNELAGVEAEQLAERFYHQALSVTPHVGEWRLNVALRDFMEDMEAILSSQ